MSRAHQPGSRLPFVFILVTLTLDAIGIGLILPVLPDLLREVHGGGLAAAAVWGGVLATSFAVMQFLCGPTLGSLSDRFGRRPVLMVSLFVLGLDYLVMATANSIWLLLAARIVGGVAAATQATAAAFIADISEPGKKSQNFGLIGAAFGIGFVLGPILGGLLAEFGTRAPFYAAAGLAFVNLAFGAIVLPETVTDANRRAFRLGRANPFGALRHIRRLPQVSRLLVLFFLYEFAFIVYPATWAFFTQERYGWTPASIGLSLAAFGVGMALVQGGLIRWIIPRFGERTTVLYGFAFNFLAFLVLATVTSGTLAMMFLPLTALGAVVTPALQGLMSRRAGADQQGELQGVISSAKALATIVSPLVMTQVFWAFTHPGAATYQPGAPFFLSAALMLACAAVFLAAPRRTMA
jgi:DHA1 family tetracycline resistance protein-like MFS transporter